MTSQPIPVTIYRDKVTHIQHTHITHYGIACWSTHGLTHAQDPQGLTRNTEAVVFTAPRRDTLEAVAATFGLRETYRLESPDGPSRIWYDAGEIWYHSAKTTYYLAVDRRRMAITLAK